MKTPQEKRIARGAVAHYEDAQYYDHAYKRRRDDVKFYVSLAKRGPVLELGAGTGRVASAIAATGVEVVAVEPVKAMRTRGQEKTRGLPVTWRAGDIRSVRLRRKFSLVIAPFNVFMHLYTRRDLERALATVLAHLAPNGRFAFDVLTPDLRAMVRDPGRLYRGPSVKLGGKRYDYFEAFDYDALRQVQLVSMVFQNLDELADLRSLPLSQRQFFPEELAMLLHYNGFDVERRYGDFTGGPLTADSESQLVIARKSRT
ncbi:MAG TPA: class I SAM-dependent methyltransferase [Polyangiales bacterium]|nr:class I SAM-dependent methyltransferase [Polyangiales bacterium]